MPDDPTSLKQRAPTLYLIIVAKLIKGVALMLLALGVYSLSDNDLPKEFHHLLRWLHIDPEREFFTMLTTKLSTVTPRKVVWVALGTFVYGGFLLVEAVGLYRRAWWAGWLVIGSSLFFIPIEIYDLLHRFSWVVMTLLGFNLFIAWYLFANRHRLFRHHH